MQNWYVDYDYIKTLGYANYKRKKFFKRFWSDSTAIIINETTAKILGYADPIGKKFMTVTDDQGNTIRIYNHWCS